MEENFGNRLAFDLRIGQSHPQQTNSTKPKLIVGIVRGSMRQELPLINMLIAMVKVD